MTVTVYGVGCKATKKAKQWLEQNNVPYVDRNILQNPITLNEIQGILQMTEDGTNEILAARSKVYKNMEISLDELSLQELMKRIHENPGLLKSPLMIDGKRFQAGYSEEAIRQFVPRKTRLNWRINRIRLVEG